MTPARLNQIRAKARQDAEAVGRAIRPELTFLVMESMANVCAETAGVTKLERIVYLYCWMKRMAELPPLYSLETTPDQNPIVFAMYIRRRSV